MALQALGTKFNVGGNLSPEFQKSGGGSASSHTQVLVGVGGCRRGDERLSDDPQSLALKYWEMIMKQGSLVLLGNSQKSLQEVSRQPRQN